jgi:hypothetical protein
MAKLIYPAITSLDGYVADEQGNFGWAAPDPDVHAVVNDQERTIGTPSAAKPSSIAFFCGDGSFTAA